MKMNSYCFGGAFNVNSGMVINKMLFGLIIMNPVKFSAVLIIFRKTFRVFEKIYIPMSH